MRLWSGHLETQKLFDQVNEQLNEAEEILARWAEEEQQKSERKKSTFFNLVAGIGLPLGLYSVFSGDAPDWMRLCFAVGSSVCVFFGWRHAKPGSLDERSRKSKRNMLLRRWVLSITALVVFLAGMYVCGNYQELVAKYWTFTRQGTAVQGQSTSAAAKTGQDSSSGGKSTTVPPPVDGQKAVGLQTQATNPTDPQPARKDKGHAPNPNPNPNAGTPANSGLSSPTEKSPPKSAAAGSHQNPDSNAANAAGQLQRPPDGKTP